MTQRFKLGDIVRFNPSNQIGIVAEINEERMKVDFFLENEEGYAPKSFWDCYELIRAADNHPDTERLDWLATQDNIDITLSNVINLKLHELRSAIDVAMHIDVAMQACIAAIAIKFAAHFEEMVARGEAERLPDGRYRILKG